MGGHSYRRDVKARDYVVFDPAGEPVCRGFTLSLIHISEPTRPY